MDNSRKEITPEQIGKIVSSGAIWAIIAVALIIIVIFSTVKFRNVEADEVGILLNRLSGETEVIPAKGMQAYNGILSEFFVLDNTLQTLDMTGAAERGDRSGRDDLKIKTIDGSDVYVDIKVMYRIIPEKAATVLRTSGPGTLFKEKWTRDYTRAVCRNYLGELTTEGFYDAAERDVKLQKAKQDINKRLLDFGVKVDNISIPRRPQFYADYEAMIKRKKLADQGVEEEKSKALAAKQKQQTLLVEENNKKNVELEQFKGQMEQLVIAAEAEAERKRKEAEAYYQKTTVAAKADLYKLKQDAEAMLALKKAEAEGLMALKRALEGEGGINMVKLAYARRLKEIKLSGQPFSRMSETQRMEHELHESRTKTLTGGAE